MATFPATDRSADGGRGISRRRLPVLLGFLATLPEESGEAKSARLASASRSTGGPAEMIAEIAPVSLPEMPLEVHIARVVLPIGVRLPSATPSGVRLLAVTAGALTVELAETAPSALLARAAPTGQRLVVPAGRAIALDAGTVVGVGNAGTRPVVTLDAAVFGEGDRPPARAFTTDAGVGFQVLAGGGAGLPPPGPCAVALARREIPPGTTVALTGTTLAYAESGTGWASATTGDIRHARAAGQAPGSSAGPWRVVEGRRDVPLTAGSALMLGRESVARIGNTGQRAVRLLLVTVLPAGQATVTKESAAAAHPSGGTGSDNG